MEQSFLLPAFLGWERVWVLTPRQGHSGAGNRENEKTPRKKRGWGREEIEETSAMQMSALEPWIIQSVEWKSCFSDPLIINFCQSGPFSFGLSWPPVPVLSSPTAALLSPSPSVLLLLLALGLLHLIMVFTGLRVSALSCFSTQVLTNFCWKDWNQIQYKWVWANGPGPEPRVGLLFFFFLSCQSVTLKLSLDL